MIYFFGIVFALACWLGGWRYAHITIATECERLGGFFVDSKTYRCVEIQEEKNQ